MSERDANTFPDKVLNAVRSEQMLGRGEHVLVALSGGADSMSLLHVLLEQRETLALGSVMAAHVNHGLRGGEAARDEAFVRAQCERLGVPLLVHTADVSAEAAAHGEGLEEAGRRVRYTFLAEQAARLGARIATAHTRSDSVETLLLHMTRGCGLRGLCGIPPVREITEGAAHAVVIRPLIDCTRADVEEYCTAHAVTFVSDSTNSDTAYARNRIRARVVPELTAINPQVEAAFARLMQHVREDALLLDKLAVDALHVASMTDGYDGYDAAKLAELPPALRSRVLSIAVCEEDNEAARGLTERQIEFLIKILKTGGALTLGHGIKVQVAQGRFLVIRGEEEASCRNLPTSNNEIPLHMGISYIFYGRIYRPTLLTLDEFEKRQKIHKNLLKNSLNYDKIAGNLILRSRLPGDAYRPAGRGVKKTLKKLLGEAKVPAGQRGGIPILCDEQAIVLVGGFGCDERVRIDPTCRRVLVLETVE